MRVAELSVSVVYDEKIVDADSIALALDTLMETALSTPDVLDSCGNPAVGGFYVNHDCEASVSEGEDQCQDG